MKQEIQPYKRLDAAIEAALRASIERFGVLMPVVEDQHGRVLDGHQRERIAKELDIDYPIIVRQVKDDAEAEEIARTLNEDRRHLTPEQRQKVAQALRDEGHSYRAIGGALGISQTQARQDATGVKHFTPDQLDEEEESVPVSVEEAPMTVGLDGKSYPAQRREPKPKRDKGQKGDQAKQDKGRKPIGSYGYEWSQIQDVLRNRLLVLDPETVAQSLFSDHRTKAKHTVKECLKWFEAFSTAMETTKERIAQ